MAARQAGGERARAPRPRNGIVTLRPVGVTEDGRYLSLARRADARSGGWRIAVDDELLTWLEEAVARAFPPPPSEPKGRHPKVPPRFDSMLSPKEIQALLRQGRSVPSVAKKAGVSVEWVERFAVPIVAERVGMALRARKTTLVRSRRGASAAPLGAAVEANIRDRGVRMNPGEIDAAWDAVRQSRGGHWVVTFSYSHRNRDLQARWEFDPEGGRVRPTDKLAADLGWVEPRGPRRPPR